MKYTAVVPIVEGHGEVRAFPALLFRVRDMIAPKLTLKVNPPIRVKVGKFLNSEEEFYRHVRLAAERAVSLKGHVLILLDSEDDCPRELGPSLLERAKRIRNDVSFVVALAYREYETWFIAAANSLRGVSGLPEYLAPPTNPEHIRSAKEWFSRYLPNGYDEIKHQWEFTRAFSFAEARSVRSFSRFLDKLEPLLTEGEPVRY
jgi:hypothetical protein